VKRGPIRVDADELTYTLHIQLRYELENPAAVGRARRCATCATPWNSSMEQRLGIKPQNDSKACCRTCTGPVGSFGYFPSYALGAVMAAQFYDALREAVPDVDSRSRAVTSAASWAGCSRTSTAGRAGQRAGTAQTLDRQAAVRRAALRYLEAKYLEPRRWSAAPRHDGGAGLRATGAAGFCWIPVAAPGGRPGAGDAAALSYHAFADCRAFWSIPNFLNVSRTCRSSSAARSGSR
jgi:hypothetical protein